MRNAGVGLDLIEATPVEAAISRHGDRYLRRTYTAREIEECGGEPSLLATRFAAKEAALKALDVGDRPVPWTCVEITAVARGRFVATLSGAAAELAQVRQVSSVIVTLARSGGRAAAVAITE